ncbi:MAG: thioredoxin family protein [Gammaproteobacteria bacterium]
MVLIETPICDFGRSAIDFNLPGVDGRNWSLDDCRGERGTLIMFICNHCPYVKAIQQRLVKDTRALLEHGIKSVAVMANDSTAYPEDSFENMKKIAEQFGYPFPYLFDESQDTARAYGAVCTPDFFGYNANMELHYRGRFDAERAGQEPAGARQELYEAMLQIAITGKGPEQQIPSMGCSIKWRE